MFAQGSLEYGTEILPSTSTECVNFSSFSFVVRNVSEELKLDATVILFSFSFFTLTLLLCKLTNTLQKKLNHVREEKSLLEQQIEREKKSHVCCSPNWAIYGTINCTLRNPLKRKTKWKRRDKKEIINDDALLVLRRIQRTGWNNNRKTSTSNAA